MTSRSACSGDVSLLVDARYLSAPGLGRYTREITSRLLLDERFGSITLAGDTSTIRDWLIRQEGVPDRVTVAHLSARPFHPSSQAGWLRLRARRMLDVDVAFFPHYDAALLWHPTRSVVAVHDFTHFRMPEAFPVWKRWLGRRLLRSAVGRASSVVTGSSAARSDIVRELPDAANKVIVIPHGVDPFFSAAAGSPPPAIDALQPYLLCVGDAKPHKNHRTAVEALLRLHRQGRTEVRLVIAGGGQATDDLCDHIEACGLADAVTMAGKVSDRELRDLYRYCEALLFPSLYEGFGLPPLEAMACGAPVIASDRASVPEVVGDAGIVLDPLDADAWASAVAGLLAFPERREAMRRRGLNRATEFTWDRSAARTAAVLLDAVGACDSALSGVAPQASAH